MSISHWQQVPDAPVREADFVVIGAGLVGCAAAYHAQSAGRRVLIVEKNDLAMGASGRNAGFMMTGLDTHYHHAVARYGEAVVAEMWDISRAAVAFWQGIAEDAAVPMERIGSMLLAESEAEADDLALASQALRAAGLEHIYHESDPTGRGYFAAIERPDDCAVQPYALTRALFQASGADLLPNCEVYAIEADGDSLSLRTQRGTIQANHALLCTNGYSVLLSDYFQGRVTPTRAQVLVTEPLPQPIFHTLGYSNYGSMYYRMTFDGRFLLGGARHLHVELEADTTEDRMSPPVQRSLDDYLARYFPDVRVPVAHRWSGIMGFSADGLPQVGTLPSHPRVGFAVGFTGHGLSMGAEVARLAVEKVLHGAHAGAVDAARFDRLIGSYGGAGVAPPDAG